MKHLVWIMSLSLSFSVGAGAASQDSGGKALGAEPPVWEAGTDIEAFWLQYADSKGGLSWGKSSDYPPYEEVKEGDTLLIQLEQGPCLMEFFHSRWRRANDVRRWDPSVNAYGGCPYVFD